MENPKIINKDTHKAPPKGLRPNPTKSDWSDTAVFGCSPLWGRGVFKKKFEKKFFEKKKVKYYQNPTKSDWSDSAAFGRSPLWGLHYLQEKGYKLLRKMYTPKTNFLLSALSG